MALPTWVRRDDASLAETAARSACTLRSWVAVSRSTFSCSHRGGRQRGGKVEAQKGIAMRRRPLTGRQT